MQISLLLSSNHFYHRQPRNGYIWQIFCIYELKILHWNSHRCSIEVFRITETGAQFTESNTLFLTFCLPPKSEGFVFCFFFFPAQIESILSKEFLDSFIWLIHCELGFKQSFPQENRFLLQLYSGYLLLCFQKDVSVKPSILPTSSDISESKVFKWMSSARAEYEQHTQKTSEFRIQILGLIWPSQMTFSI